MPTSRLRYMTYSSFMDRRRIFCSAEETP
jgi:hypothetical protein